MTPMPRSVGELHDAVRSHVAGLLRRSLLLGVGAALTLLLALAWLFAGAEGWRPGSVGPLLLDLVALVALAAGIRLYLRSRARALDERAVSSAMEAASGLSDGVLQGALELQRSVPMGVSGALARKSQERMAAELAAPAPALAGELGHRLNRRAGLALRSLLAGAVVLVLLVVLSPGRAFSAWAGLAAPVSTLTGPTLPPLAVSPGDAEVPRGSAVDLRVEAPLRETVTLHWQAAGDVARSVELAVVQGAVAHTFPEVAAELRYWIAAPDGAATDRFVLTPVDPLFVTDVTLRLRFPAYTQRPAEEFRGAIPPLLLPVGTEVELQGRASRALTGAALTLEGGARIELPVEGPRFEGRFTPDRGGTYAWSFQDDAGDPAALAPEPLVFSLVPDSAPRVRIALPAPDTLLPTNLKQPLVLEAQDDYGLRSLELVAWRVTALGDSLEPVSQTVDLGGTRAALARPLLDVSRWGLLPGDQVRYFARVRDVNPRGQVARSAAHVLRMPTAEQLRRRAQGELQDAAEMLRQMQEEAARTAEETRELERAAQAPDRSQTDEGANRNPGEQASFQEQEEIRNALEEQRALTEQADSLSQGLEELLESLQDAGATDPELEEDLEELQRLLEELGGDELQEQLDDLLSRMDEMGQQEAQQTLEELTAQQEEFRAQLEEALERAQRAAVEQEFRNTTSEAEELAEEQRALAEAMESGEDRALRAQQQEELAMETSELQERMQELGDKLQELGEQDAFQELLNAQEAGEQAQANMQQAAQQAQQQPQQAQQQAQEAAEQMDEAAQRLQEAQQQMMAERAAAFQEALEQTAQDALSLAGEQSRTREAMNGATSEEMAELRSAVSAVEQGMERLAENLSMASRIAGTDDREMSRMMGEAMASLAQTRGSLERRGGSQPSPQASAEQSVAALNRVAQSALMTIQAMQEGASQAQPTPEQMMEQMEQMAQEQADVNNQAAQMMPMQLTPEMTQEMMEQLAQQQQEIASDLGQMSNQEGEEGPLGDLEAMAQEAQQLAEQLAGGRLDAQTRERQERLFHRLLDAGRSLQKEEESTERESEAPGEFERDGVAALTAGDLGLRRFQLPDAAALNQLPPAARALVLRYFQRLNRGGN